MSRKKPTVSPIRVGISVVISYLLMNKTTSALGVEYSKVDQSVFSYKFILSFVIYITYIYIVNTIIGKLYFDSK